MTFADGSCLIFAEGNNLTNFSFKDRGGATLRTTFGVALRGIGADLGLAYVAVARGFGDGFTGSGLGWGFVRGADL